MNDKKTKPDEEARQWLAIVEPEWKAFWFHQGPVVRSLKELRTVMPRLARETFEHHVNAFRNDVASWVRDVIGDQKLAKELEKTKTIADTIDVLEKRLEELDKCLAPQKVSHTAALKAAAKKLTAGKAKKK